MHWKNKTACIKSLQRVWHVKENSKTNKSTKNKYIGWVVKQTHTKMHLKTIINARLKVKNSQKWKYAKTLVIKHQSARL